MTDFEIAELLSGICTVGEFYVDSKLGIYWQYELDYFDPEVEEPHDKLWDIHCHAAEALRQFGFGYKDAWADNDSCGFWVTLNINYK